MIAVILISGCARQIIRPPDPVLSGIHGVAERIAATLTRLQRLQQSRIPPIPSYPIPQGALATPIQMNWSGRLLPAVQAVATLAGPRWTVQVVGRPPVSPPLVTINVTHTAAYQVLESLGWQAGRRTGVVVDLAHHVIQVIYVGDAHAA
jgi:hypothetical protein